MHVQNVRLWLKHKLASVLSIRQLYHQSVTAPRCTTQLRMDVHDLPLPVRRSSKRVLCTFHSNFLFFFVSCSYQKIPESVAEHRSLLIPISFNQNCLFQYHFEIFTSYLLDVMFTSRIKQVNSLFTESIYSCFQICKNY